MLSDMLLCNFIMVITITLKIYYCMHTLVLTLQICTVLRPTLMVLKKTWIKSN